MSMRRTVVRAILLLVIVIVSGILFYYGKGHTVIVDTNAITVDGKELRSTDLIAVSVDGREPEEMGRAERILADNLMGPYHSITIEDLSGSDKKAEARFKIPTSLDTVILSVPAILNGAPENLWVGPFTEARQETEEEPVQKTIQQEEKDVIKLK